MQTIPSAEIAKRVQAIQGSIPDLQRFIASSPLFTQSIQPLPDIASLTGIDFEAVSRAFTQISRNFATANFLGEFGLAEEDRSRDPEALEEQVDQQIIELAPGDAYERLKIVRFVPVTTLDQIAHDPEIMRALSSRQFESFVAGLIEKLGFEDVVLTPPSRDGGRDILATQTVHGIPIMFAFECKKYAPDRPIGPAIARALLGVISHGETRATKGVLVTTSYFTKATNDFILTEPKLDGRDFDDVVEWLREYSSLHPM